MEVSLIQSPVVEHVPLGSVTLDRIHPDTVNEVPWARRPKIVTLAPDCLSPFDRVVVRIEEPDLSAALQKDKPGECDRHSDESSDEQPLSTESYHDDHRRRYQKRELRSAGYSEKKGEGHRGEANK